MTMVQADSEEPLHEARELFMEYFDLLRQRHGGHCHDLYEDPADLRASIRHLGGGYWWPSTANKARVASPFGSLAKALAR